MDGSTSDTMLNDIPNIDDDVILSLLNDSAKSDQNYVNKQPVLQDDGVIEHRDPANIFGLFDIDENNNTVNNVNNNDQESRCNLQQQMSEDSKLFVFEAATHHQQKSPEFLFAPDDSPTTTTHANRGDQQRTCLSRNSALTSPYISPSPSPGQPLSQHQLQSSPYNFSSSAPSSFLLHSPSCNKYSFNKMKNSCSYQLSVAEEEVNEDSSSSYSLTLPTQSFLEKNLSVSASATNTTSNRKKRLSSASLSPNSGVIKRNTNRTKKSKR